MARLLTIGMAAYEEFDSVYFTLEALRTYHGDAFDLVVVDNAPRPCVRTEHAVAAVGGRYAYRPDLVGTSRSRDAVFTLARTPWVMVIDSHVLLEPGAVRTLERFITHNPDFKGVLSGPLVGDDGRWTATHWEPAVPNGLWGTWATRPEYAAGWGRGGTEGRAFADAEQPFAIPMMGLGLYAAPRAAWPGFHPAFRGFGGEEGYVHELVRRQGGRVLCHPGVRWRHKFRDIVSFGHNPVPYPNRTEDHLRNLLIGHRELNVPDYENLIRTRFGKTVGDPAAWEKLCGDARTAVPVPGVVTPRPRGVKILAVWYTNNAAPPGLLSASLSSVGEAAGGSRHHVSVSASVQGDVHVRGFADRFAMNRFNGPRGQGHRSILAQIGHALEAANAAGWEYDAVAFCEHDVLYPADYFDRVGDALFLNPAAPVVSNQDYVGLNGGGYQMVKERHEPMHQLTIRRAVAEQNLARAEREAAESGQAIIEPDHAGPRADWVRLPVRDPRFMPAVHVNHAWGRLTSHGEVCYYPNAAFADHPYWGKAERYWTPRPGDQAAPPAAAPAADPAADPGCGCANAGKPQVINAAAPPAWPDAEAAFADAVARPSDFHEHAATLRALASKCEAVAELSNWDGKPALTALVASKAKAVYSFCPFQKTLWQRLAPVAGPNRLTVAVGVPSGEGADVLPEVGLLFVDTAHAADELLRLLRAHHARVSHYLVVHCTETFGAAGDDGREPGVMGAVRSFLLENRQWTAIRRDRNNHGLIVMSRAAEDKRQPPGMLRQALNFARAKARHLTAGRPVVTDRVFELRMAECAVCPHRMMDACGACGCPIEEKASWATEECGAAYVKEEPRWRATSDPADIEGGETVSGNPPPAG